MKRQKAPQFNSEKELSEYLLGSVGSTLKQAIKVTVEYLLKLEMQQLRSDIERKTEEREKMYFNGSYSRHLLSPAGKVENINVPRFRGGNEIFDIRGMDLFEEEQKRFHQLIGELHLRGLSQSKINQLCKD